MRSPDQGSIEEDITGRFFRYPDGKPIRLLDEWWFSKPRKPGRGKTFAKMAEYEIAMARWRKQSAEIEAYKMAKQRALEVSNYTHALKECDDVSREMSKLNVKLARCSIRTMDGLRRKAGALFWWCTVGRPIELIPLTVWMLASLLDDILGLEGKTTRYKTVQIFERLTPRRVWFEMLDEV